MNRTGTDISSQPSSEPPVSDSAAGTKFLNRYGLIILAVASFLVFVMGLDNVSLWEPDQPKYAEVTRNMIESGDYLLLTYHGKNYPNKPPLMFWMIASFSRITGGVDETAARLPSALAGVGVVLLTFIFGRRFLGARVGFIAGAMLLTTSYFVEHSRYVRMDTPLVFFMMLMLAIFYLAHDKGRAKWWMWSAFFLLGALGTMTKGPVGILLPLLICLAFSLVTRDWRAWHWSVAAGALIYVIVLGAWLLPLWHHAGDKYMYNILIQQNIGRLQGNVPGVVEAPRPFYYHFVGFPEMFQQWAPLFLLALLTAGWRLFRLGERDARIWFAVIWIAVIYVFFTIVPTRHRSYTLPALPAAALLIAWMLDSFINGRGERLIEQIAKWAVAVMLGASAAIVALATVVVILDKAALFTKDTKDLFRVGELVRIHAAEAGVLSAVVLAAGVIGAVSAMKRRWGRAITALVIVGAAGCVFTYFILYPINDRFKTSKSFETKINELAGDAEMGWYGDLPQTITFYNHRKYRFINNAEELRAYMAAGTSGEKYCLMPAAKLNDLTGGSGSPATAVILKDRVGSQDVILVRSGAP